MKELDALLSAYLHERYDDAPEAEKAAFRELLELPDPDLVGYLLQRQVPDSEALAGVVDYILGRTAS
jgi:succinate dehydrogenase flavin-adding protein (antitoxin of CptAB toxin-antitoxin module)